MVFGRKKRFSYIFLSSFYCIFIVFTFFLMSFTTFSVFHSYSLFLKLVLHCFCFVFTFFDNFLHFFSQYSTGFHHCQPFSPFSTALAVLHRCYYPQTPRDSVSLACSFFFAIQYELLVPEGRSPLIYTATNFFCPD